MANSKISALTSATTPLAGTETLPIVQGGATVKTTVADITNGGGYAGSFTTLSATGVTTVQAGTALLPAITTTGDTNTGIFFPAADTIAFTEGGAEAVRINSSGNVGIANTLSLSNPVGGTTTFADPDGSTVDGYLRIGNETATTNRNSVLELIGYGASAGGIAGGGAIIFTNTRYGSSSSPSFSQMAAITGKRDGAGTGLLKFWTGTTTALVERMRIDSSGNLGIGVTPAVKLDVLGTIQAAAAATQDAVRLAGRAGGTGTFAVTLTPTTLTASRTLTLPDATTTVVGTDATQTLTNKRIDPRVVSAASASSLTPSIATADIYAYTALAAGLTINAPTGTPVDGNKLMFRLLDNGTARALTWNATYTVIGVTLPTTTVANKTTYVGCIYNANNTRWDVIAVATQA
jgi:hypothetical protein